MKKRSFLERLTGSIRLEDNEEKNNNVNEIHNSHLENTDEQKENAFEEEVEAELTIDLYQTPNDIVVQTMVAGVQPENLSINITRDQISISGKREKNQAIDKNDYFVQELYWGSFSRTISLPEEIDVEDAEAIERHGLLIIKLPKIDKNRSTKLKIKSI